MRSPASYVSVALENAQLYVELSDEKNKSEEQLLNILPEEVAAELKATGGSQAKFYEQVSVLFTDFDNFAATIEIMPPGELVRELNVCFSAFDGIATKYGLEKIKTMGDPCLAICCLPVAHPAYAFHVVNAALEIRVFMVQRYAATGDKTFRIRLGAHSGSVVAGIVGVKKFAYYIWSDTVNTAARIELASEPGIFCERTLVLTYFLLQNSSILQAFGSITFHLGALKPAFYEGFSFCAALQWQTLNWEYPLGTGIVARRLSGPLTGPAPKRLCTLLYHFFAALDHFWAITCALSLKHSAF